MYHAFLSARHKKKILFFSGQYLGIRHCRVLQQRLLGFALAAVLCVCFLAVSALLFAICTFFLAVRAFLPAILALGLAFLTLVALFAVAAALSCSFVGSLVIATVAGA